MKHYTQFIHLLRAGWEGDQKRLTEQALALADIMEGEGDTAHARMLRFTLQALQNQPPARDAHTLLKAPAPKTPKPPKNPIKLDLDLGGPSVSLTFGTWDETRH